MKITDVFLEENENKDKIILYKEGIFYKAYERSAYAFIRNVKNYNPIKRFVKIVNADVVSIGFPCLALEKISAKIEIVQSDEKQIIIKSNKIDENAFLEWKNSIMLNIPVLKNNNKEESLDLHLNANLNSFTISNAYNKIFDRIKEFPIESKNPLECMLFISELKKEING